jgi:centrin-1
LKRVAEELDETITDEELRQMVQRADLDRDEYVSAEEFYTILTRKID